MLNGWSYLRSFKLKCEAIKMSCMWAGPVNWRALEFESILNARMQRCFQWGRLICSEENSLMIRLENWVGVDAVWIPGV